MRAQHSPMFVLAAAALAAIGGGYVAASPAPPQAEPKNRESSPVAAIPLKLGRSIPLAVQSSGVEWRGNTFHLVNLGSIQFELDKRASRLTADVKAGVMGFDDVDYDVSAAVFDAAGRLLGVACTRCKVRRMWAGKVAMGADTLSLDFGVSLDYERAAGFMVGISKRKVLTPDEWYKQKDAVVLTPRPIVLNAKPSDGGWREWEGIRDPSGMSMYAEFLTSLFADDDANV